MVSLIPMLQQYLKKILNARVYDVASKTPLEPATNLSQRFNANILLKREDLQPVFSFKLRGAYNKIVQLSEAERANGVVAASAGNHAQGVALAAQRLGCHATIVMPKTTPDIKVKAVKNYGAKVVLHGDAYDDAREYADELTKREGKTFIHPYDDPDVIAGQGTIAKEILDDCDQPVDAIFVCTGGGGLLAGISAYIKAIRPEIKIISVESEESACMQAAIRAGERVILPEVGLFADGVAVKQAGEETFRVAQQTVDQCMTVSVDEICAAIRDVFEDTRSIPEPAGALAVAGVKKYMLEQEAQLDQATAGAEANTAGGKMAAATTPAHIPTMVAIVSGANMNFDRLRHVAERAQLGEQREALFAVTIPEQPGSFLKFCKTIGKRAITEFNYRYANTERAKIFVGVAISGDDERYQLADKLNDQGFQLVDLTDNEVAKLHVRYMVGGHVQNLVNERLFRVEFPERPGALAAFLQKVGSEWNISLFHYRNHGAAFGRVLVGLQVPEADQLACYKKFDELGYNWHEETGNLAYQEFLSTP